MRAIKTNSILCLALVLSVDLLGRSATGRVGVIDYSTVSAYRGPGQINGLGKRLSIRVAASSWPELLAKVQPAFAWNGCDMLWIEKDTNGQPLFVLDEAYLYQRTNGPPQWVLLNENDDAPYDEDYGEVMGRNLRGVAKLQKSVPVADNDAGIIGDYTVVLSTNSRFGTVYEIGWQQLMANGTCLCENNRHLYLFEDMAQQLHFIGEGPGVGNSKDGANQGSSYDMTANVVWLTNSPAQIRFVIRYEDDYWTGPNGDSRQDRSLITYQDAVLSSNERAHRYGTAGHPYLLAEKGDTLGKIVERLGFFERIWDDWPNKEKQQAEKKRILDMWRAAVIQLNPNLPQHGKIKGGTRVQF